MGTTRTTTRTTITTFTEDRLGRCVALPAAFGASRAAVSAAYFLSGRPGPVAARPPVPALEKCATVADELAALRGQFACYAARLEPRAVAAVTRRLLAVFEEATGGGPDPLWSIAAMIRPPVPGAGQGTGSGLALDLPFRLLDEEFGADGVVRFEDIDFPQALTHAPTRRFLREVGLPERAEGFSLETDVPLQTLDEFTGGRLIRLGRLPRGTSLVVDGTTGAVLTWSESEPGSPRPLNADVSTLAFALWLTRRERALRAVRELTAIYDGLAEAMTRTLAAPAPVPSPVPLSPSATGSRPRRSARSAGRGRWPGRRTPR
ncbi:SUKH-4 family immunity protein [Streptomyces sp. Amel2xC10]|uniref:SUKH-4 family immunity protein n=1 Tax=Streptomyces sp. Amel2xC10 TaxID=1305826 RepID=UPI000A087F9F|nr:SUKH-4 family immunity protein [Streptomyces sp. Amel2xC10]SMF08587.1 SUKH-4 immunity protein [Streptomyces sp. Amel2xC10]